MGLRHLSLAAVALLATAPALAASPVEVTRFHTPATLPQLSGTVAVTPAPGIDANSLETRVWLEAVGRALAARGFSIAGGGGARVAEVRLTRDTVAARRAGSPVSVGVGLGTGSGRWRGGSHFGLGVGLGLGLGGGGAREQIESELSVVIRDAATRAPLWEGRAVSRTRAGAKITAPAALAERLAQALFAGFPGRTGETIEVR